MPVIIRKIHEFSTPITRRFQALAATFKEPHKRDVTFARKFR
jgi:hypothetical protein